MTKRNGSLVRATGGTAALIAIGLVLQGCNTAGKATGAQDVAGTMQVCSSCHGSDGRGVAPTFPRLAGQTAEYLATQLKAFRDKTRADPHAHTYMWGMAAKLSDSTIDSLAAAYAAMPPAPGTPGDPAEMAAGAAIFRNGIEARDVPACQACHGEKAEGNGPYPRLAGQQRGYLERQLTAFASNARANEIMHANSINLAPAEINQVAAYLSAQ